MRLQCSVPDKGLWLKQDFRGLPMGAKHYSLLAKKCFKYPKWIYSLVLKYKCVCKPRAVYATYPNTGLFAQEVNVW